MEICSPTIVISHRSSNLGFYEGGTLTIDLIGKRGHAENYHRKHRRNFGLRPRLMSENETRDGREIPRPKPNCLAGDVAQPDPHLMASLSICPSTKPRAWSRMT